MASPGRIRIHPRYGPLMRLQESTQEAVRDPKALETRIAAVRQAFRARYPYPEGEMEGPQWFLEDVHDKAAIAVREDQNGSTLYRFGYSYSDDGTVEFDEPERIKAKVTYTTIAESIEDGSVPSDEATRLNEAMPAGPHPIMESLDEGEGYVWRVTLVKPGISRNGRRYSRQVLAEAAHLYEGAKAFDGHRDPAAKRSSAAGQMVGWYENVAVAEDGSLQADLHLVESAQHIRKLFLTAWKHQRPSLIGFSHDISAHGDTKIVGGRKITDVTQIAEVNSVDTVADPSAGGRLERMVAAVQEATMTPGEFLRRLRAGELTTEQIQEAIEANPALEAVQEAFASDDEPGDNQGGAGTTPATTVTEAAPAGATTITETGMSPTLRRLVIREAFDTHRVPQHAQEQLRAQLENLDSEEAILERVQEASSMWDALTAQRPEQLPGQRNVTVTEAEQDKFQHALDAMIAGVEQIEGVPAFRSIKEAYSRFTGRQPYGMGDEDFNRWILAESVGAVPTFAAAQRFTESLTSASWADALGDSITRQLIREYRLDAYNSWRQIVSDISPINDFRNNERIRVGGYDVLPVVGEGANYLPLTSPTDEAATYAIGKRGGTEDYTLEMVANDDLRALRRIPTNLGVAAALTLYRAIWNTTIAGNAVIYDAVALFAAGHGNDFATTPLGEAGLQTIRTGMVTQARLGEASGFLGLQPRFLVVPPELYVLAAKLTQSQVAITATEDANTPNVFQGMVPIEVPTLTDPNDWFVIADPNTVPTIEVGFYQGRQDPELFVQDQPTIGSVFTADKFTWKIRHIWGLAVLDYRGFARATNV